MRIYEVLALYPAPEGTPVHERAVEYSGIVANTDDAAIAVAKDRHMQAGLRLKDVEFQVSDFRTVLCPTALVECA